MSLPGYHPICVLFQGNDCSLDGTYRLVCRHQVRQRDFKPGDVVEVDMGEDNDDNDSRQDDVTVITEHEEDSRWKDAIALGEEMVMSLLRNMCKNQPAGKSPWSTGNQKVKRRRGQDEEKDYSKRVKMEPGVEECTTSQGRTDRVDSSQNDHLLQKVLSAVHSIQVSQDLVMSAMHCIQQTQQQLSSQVMAVQKSLSRLEENANRVTGYDTASNLTVPALATPVSIFLSQTGTSSPQVPSDSMGCLGITQTRLSPGASTPSSSGSQPQIIISNPTSQSQPSLSTFPSQDHLQDSMPPLPLSYPSQGGTLFSSTQVTYNFRYTDNTESRVFLGFPDSPLTLTKNEMEDILFKTNTPAAYAYRLTGKIFTNEELLESNTSGKSNKKSGKTYRQLNPSYINIILLEVESRFPTCRDTKESTKRLFTAINERCRNERKKVVYRCERTCDVNEPILMITKTQSLRTHLQDA